MQEYTMQMRPCGNSTQCTSRHSSYEKVFERYDNKWPFFFLVEMQAKAKPSVLNDSLCRSWSHADGHVSLIRHPARNHLLK